VRALCVEELQIVFISSGLSRSFACFSFCMAMQLTLISCTLLFFVPFKTAVSFSLCNILFR